MDMKTIESCVYGDTTRGFKIKICAVEKQNEEDDEQKTTLIIRQHLCQ